MKCRPANTFVIWFPHLHHGLWPAVRKQDFSHPSAQVLVACQQNGRHIFPMSFSNVWIRVWYFTHPVFLLLYWKLTACWKPHPNFRWTVLNHYASCLTKSFGLCARDGKQHCWNRCGNFWETQYGQKFVFDRSGSVVAHKFSLTLWEGVFLFIYLKMTLFIVEYVHTLTVFIGNEVRCPGCWSAVSLMMMIMKVRETPLISLTNQTKRARKEQHSWVWN